MKVILPLALAAGCYAACNNVTLDGDMLIASCTDEATGLDFQYLDMDGFVKAATEKSTIESASMMYDRYVEGKSNSTADVSSHLQRRAAKNYWNECNAGDVSGVCNDDYEIAYSGGLNSFAQVLKGIISTVNTSVRLYQKPRSACTNNGYGNVCFSWANYYSTPMSGTEVSALTNGCTQTCQQAHYSCEARVEPSGSSGAIEFFCVSNRATGCGVVSNIYAC